MQGMKKWQIGLAVMLVFGLVSLAFAHGDVTPHHFDVSMLKPLGKKELKTNPYRGNKLAIKRGSYGYYHNCAECHGLRGICGGMAPDLLQLTSDCLSMKGKQKKSCMDDSDEYFKDVVMRGHMNSEGRVTMPAYDKVFTQENVWALKAYLDQRTIEVNGKNQN